jgi:hypothetical protein
MPETSYSYSVTVFDPEVTGPDHLPTIVSGPTEPYVSFSNRYACTSIAGADGYQWRTARVVATNFLDGAETGSGNFVAATTAGYSVITNKPGPPSGDWLFHLAHPEPVGQSLQVIHSWLVAAGTELRFRSRLARATTSQVARVQVSLDDGIGWRDIYRQAGSGGSGENNFTLRTVSLSGYAGRLVLLRFNYYREGFGDYESGTDRETGWFFDDIVVTNVQQLVNPTTTPTATASLGFVPGTAGDFALLARPLLFGGFPIEWGPAVLVTATTGAPPVIVLEQPLVAGAQVRLDFTLQSGAASTFKLIQADSPSGPWSTNASATLTTNAPGSSYRFTTAIESAARFYQVQTP